MTKHSDQEFVVDQLPLWKSDQDCVHINDMSKFLEIMLPFNVKFLTSEYGYLVSLLLLPRSRAFLLLTPHFPFVLVQIPHTNRGTKHK